ncbi:hypothetical protein DB346_22605 [Verrucomicrobia bacterium LW23]|nr:hypothetical protein DB346_22605 [Verrucomicrobia bacterium LW23]
MPPLFTVHEIHDKAGPGVAEIEHAGGDVAGEDSRGVGVSAIIERREEGGGAFGVSGRIRVCTPYAVLDQQVSMLDPSASIRDNFLHINPGSNEQACRASLARFMFRADAALQMVSTLSGGQLLRAGLACVLGSESPPPFLILDEPTNHLDIDSIETVEAGLRAYDGALLVVSHDETFLSAIGIETTLELPSFTGACL